MQTIITYIIIAAAVAFFALRLFRRKKGDAGCSCCSNSSQCGAKDGSCTCGCSGSCPTDGRPLKN